jgi:hypothetical protein
MKLKIFKPALLLVAALLAAGQAGFAQQKNVSVSSHSSVNISANIDDKDFEVNLDDLGKNLKAGLKDLGKNISLSINNNMPKISVNLDNLGKDLDLDINPKIELNLGDLTKNLDLNVTDNDGDVDGDDNQSSLKVKNYTKSYPIDANDQIKLSSQYGKIIVNTWDRHEVKVDIQIKAEAANDDDAQRLLDGVQINDSKNGDQVSFRTQIERNDGGGSWKIWNWGGNNKKHKLTINYTVYMPARTDLNVEESYGSIELPNLDGRVKISSSYGSVTAENLSNPGNNIEGSYGSLKVANLNGGKLDYSYGSAEIEECNNLKADLSYGSFKLGKLKGSADINMSYVGGFKIEEVASSVKRLNIDASYSGVALGVPNSNFEFDITTSYGGFNYNDDKVTIISKTPPDGSKHIGTTRNYKGHVGKGNSDAKVNIQTSYGGVNFE